MNDYETPWVDDHDPLCPPYLGARGGRAECAICEALEHARADRREQIAAEPNEIGWYSYSGGAMVMIFHLREGGRWSAHFDNGESTDCDWGYIAQALSVWDLVRLDPKSVPRHTRSREDRAGGPGPPRGQ